MDSRELRKHLIKIPILVTKIIDRTFHFALVIANPLVISILYNIYPTNRYNKIPTIYMLLPLFAPYSIVDIAAASTNTNIINIKTL